MRQARRTCKIFSPDFYPKMHTMALPKIDFKKLSDAELKGLIADAQSEIEARAEVQRQAAIDQIKTIAAEAGLSLADLAKGAKRGRAPAAAKYRNPDNPDQTWSGRGKKPKWVVAALSAGKALSDLAI